MSTKSTGNGVNSAVPRRDVYSSANASLRGPHGTRMLIPGRAVEFQASLAGGGTGKRTAPRVGRIAS
jgi:hypothetical protein